MHYWIKLSNLEIISNNCFTRSRNGNLKNRKFWSNNFEVVVLSFNVNCNIEKKLNFSVLLVLTTNWEHGNVNGKKKKL